MSFELGDQVFHLGSWEPVTILGYAYIPDGVGNSTRAYEVMMEGWTGSQKQAERGLVSYEENVERMTEQLDARLAELHRKALEVTTSKQALERLLAWGAESRQPGRMPKRPG